MYLCVKGIDFASFWDFLATFKILKLFRQCAIFYFSFYLTENTRSLQIFFQPVTDLFVNVLYDRYIGQGYTSPHLSPSRTVMYKAPMHCLHLSLFFDLARLFISSYELPM
jgi:hypothetical protein